MRKKVVDAEELHSPIDRRIWSAPICNGVAKVEIASDKRSITLDVGPSIRHPLTDDEAVWIAWNLLNAIEYKRKSK